jgi:hypothetical protein
MTYTTEDLYKAILITAVEGGTGYWAQVSGYKPDECRATLHEIEGGDIHTVNAEVIKRGIEEIAEGGIVNSAITDTCRMREPERLALNADAEVADCIVQVGLFGNLIYG